MTMLLVLCSVALFIGAHGAALGDMPKMDQSLEYNPFLDMASEFQSHANQDQGASSFVICMAKCLGKSVTEVEGWVKECGKDAKCWLEKVGGAALKCVGECLATSSLDMSEEPAFVADEAIPPFVECLGKCLLKSIVPEIADWVKACGQDAKCWLGKVGGAVVKCIGSCIPYAEQTEAEVFSKLATVEEQAIPPFVKCLGKCLLQSIVPEIGDWVKACGQDAKCWLAKVGGAVVKCIGSCIPYAEQTEEFVSVEDQAIPPFVECMGKCLLKSIVPEIGDWVKACGHDAKCWLGKVGGAVVKCIGSCIPYAEQTEAFSKLATVDEQDIPPIVKCLGKCLLQSIVPEIGDWVKACGQDAKCWLGKVGGAVVKCIGSCIPYAKQTEEDVTLEEQDIPPIVKCLGKCLLQSIVPEIGDWVKACGQDAKCWLGKVGGAVVKCIGSCIPYAEQTEAEAFSKLATVDEQDIPPIVKCLGKCLLQSIVPEIGDWVKACGHDAKCWLGKVGGAVVKCIGSCIPYAKQTEEDVTLEEQDIPPIVKCLGKCLLQSIVPEIGDWVKACGQDAKCWLGKVGGAVVKCIGSCIPYAEQTEAEVFSQLATVDEQAIPPFVECLGKCLLKSIVPEIADWVQACGHDAKCWLGKVGGAIVKCIGSCIPYAEQTGENNRLPSYSVMMRYPLSQRLLKSAYAESKLRQNL
ncbi:uncharacterized protein LOC106172416 [Lingula anatina]|uniref:Uncharacterized protein LOC106172416 n=1 Tax=Lingula anatina TaxID=7574 RepID=A0A1S3JE18_LINAN|nr:uncharacterized protein LOC106172416 [Lingula anatina]|eukprot:XP_013408573.1 uncharacterized protein LOC106172416 [Lingula anatina]